ncbi:hypothetical protein HKCCE4037_14830 [Rhodobacterales bacterium HKCCE4037]|nr:hypothetical protein [Rhodobacterales bacterium HKCCE4037]
MKGSVALLLACLVAGTGAAQEPPHPRAALLQCLMTAADPGARVDRICAGLAMDVCGVGRAEDAIATCRAEMACRLIEEAVALETRRGRVFDYDAWAAEDAACDGAVACSHGIAMDHWIAARQSARDAGVPVEVANGEVAQCWLD